MGFSIFKKKKTEENSTEIVNRNNDYNTIKAAQPDPKTELERSKVDAFNKMVEAEREANYNAYDLQKSKIQATTEVASLAFKTINNVADVWKTSKIVEQNIAAINSKTTLELAKIASDYNKFHAALNHIFEGRNEVLNRTYELMDEALANNDREMIIHSLRAMSDIVTSRPFEDFDKFMDDWDDMDNTETLELGF